MSYSKWKYWAPLQNKESKEIASRLTDAEKEELEALAREYGRKTGFFSAGLFAVFTLPLWVFTDFVLSTKLILIGVVFLAVLALQIKFLMIPYRKKQKTLLKKSEYSKKKNISI